MKDHKYKRRGPYTDEGSFIAGQWLAEAMEKAGITQAELGRRTGKQPSQISRVINSRADPIFGTLLELIRACGVELVVEFRDDKSK